MLIHLGSDAYRIILFSVRFKEMYQYGICHISLFVIYKLNI